MVQANSLVSVTGAENDVSRHLSLDIAAVCAYSSISLPCWKRQNRTASRLGVSMLESRSNGWAFRTCAFRSRGTPRAGATTTIFRTDRSALAMERLYDVFRMYEWQNFCTTFASDPALATRSGFRRTRKMGIARNSNNDHHRFRAALSQELWLGVLSPHR